MFNHAGLDYVVSRVGLALQGSFRGLYVQEQRKEAVKFRLTVCLPS